MSDTRRRPTRAAVALLACLAACGGCEENTPVRSGRGSPVVVVSAAVDPSRGDGPVRPEATPALPASPVVASIDDDDPPLMQTQETAIRNADLYRIAAVDPAELEAASRQVDDVAG